MRVAILISLMAMSLGFAAARADEPFLKTDLGSHTGYIIPETYATAHRADVIASLPWHMSVEGFWTPTEVEVAVAERAFHELIHRAAKDPMALSPDMGKNSGQFSPEEVKHEQDELALVGDNEDAYARQFVGLILADSRKLIICNYAAGLKADPSVEYLNIEKLFVDDGTIHFLQCKFDPDSRTCSNVAMIGSWQPQAK